MNRQFPSAQTHGERISLLYGLSFTYNNFTGITAVLLDRNHQYVRQRHLGQGKI